MIATLSLRCDRDRSIATTYNEESGFYESDLITSIVETVSDEWGILYELAKCLLQIGSVFK